jgi:hypothetical protein
MDFPRMSVMEYHPKTMTDNYIIAGGSMTKQNQKIDSRIERAGLL